MNAGDPRTTDSPADVESDTRDDANAAQAAEGCDPSSRYGLQFPVTIIVTSYRKGLCDADGISAKAAIDGLVHSGLLPDDSPEFVAEVRFRQVVSKDERTVIEVTDE